mmetsp:Transcript_12013/g.34431  ORF Transcript_12013/g.34431 Transcript_12013/m.34431 type:complete len:93 (+) Transcript_12013:2522-2800(+)
MDQRLGRVMQVLFFYGSTLGLLERERESRTIKNATGHNGRKNQSKNMQLLVFVGVVDVSDWYLQNVQTANGRHGTDGNVLCCGVWYSKTCES